MTSLHEPIGLRAYEAAALGEAFAEEHEAYDDSGRVNTAKIIRQLGGVFNEAYYFAIGMTMNRSFIEWQAEAAVGDVDAAAKRLWVPWFAMLTRIKQLELTTPSAP